MSQGTNRERIVQNNVLLEEIKQTVHDLPNLSELDDSLNTQTELTQELLEKLDDKASGGSKPNVFMQTTEPSKKNGIWLKSSETFDQVVFDRNVYSSEEWNTEKIIQLKPIPYGFYKGSAVSIDTDIYLVGGEESKTNMYKYNTLTDTYTQLTDIPYDFYRSQVALIGTDIYLVGGSGSKTKMYKYDTLTDSYTQLTNIPYSFQWCTVVSIGTDIYLVGCPASDSYMYKYDTLTDTYTKLTNIPYQLYEGSAVSIGTDIYILGGSTSKTNMYKYNTLTDTYTKLANIPYNFCSGSAISVGTNIYLLGSGASYCQTNIYKYNILTDTYTKLANIPYQFYSGSATLTDSGEAYMFGGEGSKTRVQVLTLIPKTYLNKSVVISQGGSTHATKLVLEDQGITSFYDRVYYRDNNGQLISNIETYNGDGTQWNKISGGGN